MPTRCPVCNADCVLIDVLDFNKTCHDQNGSKLGLAGVPIYFVLCRNCGFCFAPEFRDWTAQQFSERIYNDQYVTIDPDFPESRPRACAANLLSMFGSSPPGIKHLDFGGGNGRLAALMQEANWDSVAYDPHSERSVDLQLLGKFDLITAFEVFEHVADVQSLMTNLVSLLAPNGLVLFSTMLSDGHIHPDQRLNWWYAAPRNGHISLFSRRSLKLLANDKSLSLGHFSDGFHVFYKKIPPWAAHLFGSAPAPN